MVFHRVIDGLNGHLYNRILSLAFHQHPGLKLKSVSGNLQQLFHKRRRDSPKPSLGIGDVHSRNVCKHILCNTVSESALPRNLFLVKIADSQNECLRAFCQSLGNLTDTVRRMLSVRICRHTSHSLRILTNQILKGRL